MSYVSHRTVAIALSLAVGLGCSGASEAGDESRPPPPRTEGSELSDERVDDGRQFLALPEDGSLGELEDVLIRRRDEGTPVLRIVIHTARSAAADDAQRYIDSIRALVRRLRLDPEVISDAPADTPHLTLITRHPAPLGP